MPNYEFRCRECTATFVINRPMAAAADPAECPGGHSDTVKLLSTVALGGQTAGDAPSAAGGGCCGGVCGCG